MPPDDVVPRDPELVVDAARRIAAAERIVVLTGAGISTDSGIRDFRGPEGVWTKNPEAEKMATLQVYVSDPEIRKKAWQNRLPSRLAVLTLTTFTPNTSCTAILIWVLFASGETRNVYLFSSRSP